MSAGDHVINNKKVDPKKAKARHGKIFVGGLSTELSDDDIKNFFSQFGNVNVYLKINEQPKINFHVTSFIDCRSGDAI